MRCSEGEVGRGEERSVVRKSRKGRMGEKGRMWGCHLHHCMLHLYIVYIT